MANHVDYVFAYLFAIIFGEMTIYCLFMSFVHFLFFSLLSFGKSLCALDNISRWINYLQIFFYNLFFVFSFSLCMCICVCICLVFSSFNRLCWRTKFLIWRGLIYWFFLLWIMFLKPNLNTLPSPEFSFSTFFKKNLALYF